MKHKAPIPHTDGSVDIKVVQRLSECITGEGILATETLSKTGTDTEVLQGKKKALKSSWFRSVCYKLKVCYKRISVHAINSIHIL